MHFSWLHLTDFHQGMNDQDWLWPGIREEFYQDLARLHEKCGPWDLVLFTGDLTNKGSEAEFAKVEAWLGELKERLRELSPTTTPVFLAVPGNHDLVRPEKKLPTVKVLRQWQEDQELQTEFWQEPNSPYRNVINTAFANYQNWWQGHTHKLSHYHNGMLPGDFSTTLEKEGAKLGIVGLNSSFLQLAGGDYEGKLALHTRQFRDACDGDGVAWVQQHHLCLLMTHHPCAWLDADSRQHFNGEITAHNHFALHLCGHLHETAYTEISAGGATPKRVFQGRSLFGLEHYQGKIDRSHGYAVGRITLQDKQGELCFWPRADHKQQGGQRKIVPDQSQELIDSLYTPISTLELIKPYQKQAQTALTVVLDVRLHELRTPQIEAAVAALQAMGRTVTLRMVQPGSVRLIVQGDQGDIERIQSAYHTGQLAQLAGIKVKSVQSAEMPTEEQAPSGLSSAQLLQQAQAAAIAPQAATPWTLQRLRNEGLLDQLAEVYGEPANAFALLEQAGYPRRYLPSFGTASAQDFWEGVCREIINGRIVGGMDALLPVAADQYPGNPAFAAWRASRSEPQNRTPPAPPSSPQEDQPQAAASLLITSTLHVHQLIDLARQTAQTLGIRDNIELGYSSNGITALHLSAISSQQAAQLRDGVAAELARQDEHSHVGVALNGFRDYLLHHLYLEGPDQGRFALDDVPASTRVADIVRAGIAEYDDKVWPRDKDNLQRPAVVDHVQANGKTRRLKPEVSLHESGVAEGDTLHLAPESTAGSINPMVRDAALVRVRNQIKHYAKAHPGFEVSANARQTPTEYLFSFQAASWGPPSRPGELPHPISQHQVFLSLPPDFPMKAPAVYWQSAIFHANIHPKNHAVCLGALADGYRPGMDFGELCQMLVDIAGYQNYEIREGYNPEAARWALSEQGQSAIEARGGRSITRIFLDLEQQAQAAPRPLNIRRV